MTDALLLTSMLLLVDRNRVFGHRILAMLRAPAAIPEALPIVRRTYRFICINATFTVLISPG